MPFTTRSPPVANLARFSLSNRALVALSTIVAVLAGLWATVSLRQELIPDLELPIVAAVTTLPGASPEVVEDQVTDAVEEAALGVTGLEGTTSTSGPKGSAIARSYCSRRSWREKMLWAVESSS